MASYKMNPKGKTKDDKGKVIKGSITTPNEDSEELDLAILRKPIQTSVTGFAQARKIFDLATEELKDLLSNECDILYECKVCRNIFRSLANFISHKRVYCKEKFNSSTHGHFIASCSMATELQQIKILEEAYQDSNKQIDQGKEDDQDIDRIPLTKDLSAIVEKITKNKEITINNTENQQVVLRSIPACRVAMFQNVKFQEDSQDNMQAEVSELNEILSRDKAILQEDGSFKIQSSEDLPPLPESVIQISDDDDGDEHPKCKICKQKFSTIKTLKFHMKYKHLESRLVYPCPDCLEIFSTSWSVYRHLFKVHRKTAAQIRRLRESIQAKAFKLNNPPAFYEKRKNNNTKTAAIQKITEEERLEQENQAWMDNMEGDSEIPRCGGCGRTFERRAALAAHTNTCQPRSRALARKPETKKIEIQIRKDYNKPPKKTDKAEETQKTNKTTATNPLEEAVMAVDIIAVDKSEIANSTSPEKRQENSLEDIVPSIKLPFAQQEEKSNMTALKQKMTKDINLEDLMCKICNSKSNNVQKLYDHMADHYKWLRYACKLCNFKHYTYERLPQHVKEVHKLRGDSDFYFSTVKALDGSDAAELAEASEDQNDDNDSPDSRRPSRCSSDSSRLSDDSSSSCARTELATRKRKQVPLKNVQKKRKENDEDEQSRDGLDNGETDPNLSRFDENSSDLEDVEEKLTKRMDERRKSMPIRRPIRNKTKRKNEDFEYDLSNLLKMEAQGYTAYTSNKVPQTKKEKKEKDKVEIGVDYQRLLRECCGALASLSRKTVLRCQAHMKSTYSTKERSGVFARPMIPKILARGEKASPKKESVEEPKADSQPVKETENEVKTEENDTQTNTQSPKVAQLHTNKITIARNYLKCQLSNAIAEKTIANNDNKLEEKSDQKLVVTSGPDKSKIPAIVPIKFRKESLEVMKSPLINKNITELKKAGMKTKILVIKPINRNKDVQINSNMKFQTIKLNKSLEGAKNEKVVVLQVPKVDCTPSGNTTSTDKVNMSQTTKPNTSIPINGDSDPEKDSVADTQQPENTSVMEIDLKDANSISFEDTATEIQKTSVPDQNDSEILSLCDEPNSKDINTPNTSSDSVEIVEASA